MYSRLFIHGVVAILVFWDAEIVAAPLPLPADVKVVRNVEYARPGGQPQMLDLYLPEHASKSPPPVVMWVHGGGWKNGSKDRCPGVWLVPKGYAVASINYRLIPAQWPAQMEDCRAAVRWLRAHQSEYGIDASRMAAWGGSAGGHLAALMGTLPAAPDERVQAVIDWYGPADLLTMPPNVLSDKKTRAQLAEANGAKLLGGIVMDQPEKAKSASALYQVSADDAPFLIMHGDQDGSVPIDQSKRLDQALGSAGVESTLKVIPGAGHGGKGFDTDEIRGTIEGFLSKHLKSSAKQ
jgi:acetyl esterase/lipase